MGNDPLLNKVLADYGQYMKPTQGYSEGGNVPGHDLNLKAWEEALKNKPKIEKEKYSYKGYPLTYKGNGIWEEDVPDITTRVLVPANSVSLMGSIGSPGGMGSIGGGQLFTATGEPYKPTGYGGFGMAGPNEQAYVYQTKKEPGYLLQYQYDPRLYQWDEYGRNIGKKPQLFGGALSGLSGLSGLGSNSGDTFNVGSAVRGLAKGGYVKGYAEGGEKEEDPYAYAPIQVPDMQQTQAPVFTPVTTGQVEPAGGGYVPQAQAPVLAAPMASANPEFKALIDQYTAGATDYSGQLAEARKQRTASEAAFNKTLDKLMAGQDEGPSKSELYFRLAAAFGTPSKTGAFAEGLGQAAGAAAEHAKEQRASATAKRKLAGEIALKKQELALEGIKDTEKTLLGLQAEASKDRREYVKALVTEYIQSGKPQSEAGKIAKDKGFKVGTPEYQEEVDKQAKMLIEKQLAGINATLASAQSSLITAKSTAEKAEREAIKLEPDERKAIRDDEDAMYAATTTMKNIERAKELNDLAFTNTPADKAAYRKLKATNPNDPRVVATEELENLLGTNVVSSLKATFGGNPTEGERNALRELGGLGAASKEARLKIYERTIKGLNEAKEYRGLRINKIESGGYRKKKGEGA